MDIEALVESLGHRVIGVARTHSEAVALARQKRPGLILADIQLADAEFERHLILTRTDEGRALARGVRFGRKLKLTKHQREEALA